MVRIHYTYSSHVGEVTKSKKTEKVFRVFPDMAIARKWARDKWKFLNWPPILAEASGKIEHKNELLSFLTFRSEKNMTHYISRYEMTLTETNEVAE